MLCTDVMGGGGGLAGASPSKHRVKAGNRPWTCYRGSSINLNMHVFRPGLGPQTTVISPCFNTTVAQTRSFSLLSASFTMDRTVSRWGPSRLACAAACRLLSERLCMYCSRQRVSCNCERGGYQPINHRSFCVHVAPSGTFRWQIIVTWGGAAWQWTV